MGTHGGKFTPSEQIFSQGKNVKTQAGWDIDFYDDSIRDFDAGVAQIIDALIELGEYDDTILIIGSDHSQLWGTTRRIPLIIHFPGDQYQQTIQANVQNMDLAPTLLDYLHVQKPTWMAGDSLLSGMPLERPIFGVSMSSDIEIENREIVVDSLKPPFYQFGYISVVYL